MSFISTECEECGHTIQISELFGDYEAFYHCKCTHPSRGSLLSKIIWILKGRPAKQRGNDE
mgnify:CR=1 FL=1